MTQQTVSIPGAIHIALQERGTDELAKLAWVHTKTTSKATGTKEALAYFGGYLRDLAEDMTTYVGDGEKLLYAYEMGGYGPKKLLQIADRFPPETPKPAPEAQPAPAAPDPAAIAAELGPDLGALVLSAGELGYLGPLGASQVTALAEHDLAVRKWAGQDDYHLTPTGRKVKEALQVQEATATEDAEQAQTGQVETEAAPERAALEAERASLLARLGEIDAELAEQDATGGLGAPDRAAVEAAADIYNRYYEVWHPLVMSDGQTLAGVPGEVRSDMVHDRLAGLGGDLTPTGRAVVRELQRRRGIPVA